MYLYINRQVLYYYRFFLSKYSKLIKKKKNYNNKNATFTSVCYYYEYDLL